MKLSAGACGAIATENIPELMLCSFRSAEETGVRVLKLRAPHTDVYRLTLAVGAGMELFDGAGKKFFEGKEHVLSLEKGELLFARLSGEGELFLDVEAKEQPFPQPFEVNAAPVPASFRAEGPAPITYKKREGTLYVYCNAPEGIFQDPTVINRCATRQDLSNRSVFFTMEQQSDNVKVFYGYRVRNTGKDDLFVTVRNIGYQCEGGGSYLGEREWTDFYHTSFQFPDMSDFNESQKKNFTAYFNFEGNCSPSPFRATTYRVPAGKYMYVFGGTAKDSFGHYNVGGTADVCACGGCQNGAVLFEVIGQAEGAYYVYDDPSKIAPGTEGGDSHLGIADPALYGVVHTGEDEGYVIDGAGTWVFNDETPAGKLPVTYQNFYQDGVSEKGEAGAVIPSSMHTQMRDEWVTHINVQAYHEAVGTDMTSFHTIYNKVRGDGKQLPVTVCCDRYDTHGDLANLGNWMKDYQDVFTFVNRGDREREVTAVVSCTGALCGMVRRTDGSVVGGTARFAFGHQTDEYGEGYDKPLRHTVKVPPHTAVQFVFEYNLMANSMGYVRHYVELSQ